MQGKKQGILMITLEKNGEEMTVKARDLAANHLISTFQRPPSPLCHVIELMCICISLARSIFVLQFFPLASSHFVSLQCSRLVKGPSRKQPRSILKTRIHMCPSGFTPKKAPHNIRLVRCCARPLSYRNFLQPKAITMDVRQAANVPIWVSVANLFILEQSQSPLHLLAAGPFRGQHQFMPATHQTSQVCAQFASWSATGQTTMGFLPMIRTVLNDGMEHRLFDSFVWCLCIASRRILTCHSCPRPLTFTKWTKCQGNVFWFARLSLQNP